MTAHCGIDNPAAVDGPVLEQQAAFVTAFRFLKNRITAFTSLPLVGLDQMALGTKPHAIGKMDGSTSIASKAADAAI